MFLKHWFFLFYFYNPYRTDLTFLVTTYHWPKIDFWSDPREMVWNEKWSRWSSFPTKPSSSPCSHVSSSGSRCCREQKSCCVRRKRVVVSHLHEICCSAGRMVTNRPLTASDSVFSNGLLTMTLHSQQLWKTGRQPPTEVCCLISVSHAKVKKKIAWIFCALLMQFSMLVCKC